MDYKTLKSIIEGLLFLSGDEGLSARQIAEITEQRPDLATSALEELKDDYINQAAACRSCRSPGITGWLHCLSMQHILNGWPIRLQDLLYLRRRWRRWPLWPTASRLPGWRLRRSAE